MLTIKMDWLGRCPKQRLRVDHSPQELRERLEQGLVKEDESLLLVAFSQKRRFTGVLRGGKFTIWPCKRGRKPQPEITGSIHETEGGSIIEFEIQMESMLSAWLMLMPFAAVGAIFVPFVFWLLGQESLVPFFFFSPVLLLAMPVMTFFAVASNRTEVQALLRFFLERVDACPTEG